MYYKCPYCDMRQPSNRKSCPYCGGASGTFVLIHEDNDFLDKKNGKLIDTRNVNNSRQVQRESGYRAGRLALFIVALLGYAIPALSILLDVGIIVTVISSKGKLNKGIGKAGVILATTELIFMVIIIILILVLWYN